MMSTPRNIFAEHLDIWYEKQGQTKFIELFVLFFEGPILCRTISYTSYTVPTRMPVSEQAKEYFVVESPLMTTESVKLIKGKLQVSFTTILLAIVCGGIRRFLLRNQLAFPKLVSLGIPFSSSQYPTLGKLHNDFLIAPLSAPVHSDKPLERVYDIQRQLESLRSSPLPLFLRWTIDTLSCLPVNWVRHFTKKSIFSIGYSTLPGPKKCILLPGARLEEVNFTYGTGVASLGLCFSTITYLGKLRMTIYVDKHLLPEQCWEKAEEMIDCLSEEYCSLCSLAQSNFIPEIN